MKVTVNADLSIETDDILKERELTKAIQDYLKDANKRSKSLKIPEIKIIKVKSK